MTEGSIERLFNFLREFTACGSLAAPLPVATPPKKAARGSRASLDERAAGPDPRWNLGLSSTFIDVGSGYGKVVLHAKLSVKVAKAVGIEYVPSRARMARRMRREPWRAGNTRSCRRRRVGCFGTGADWNKGTPPSTACSTSRTCTCTTRCSAIRRSSFWPSHSCNRDHVQDPRELPAPGGVGAGWG